MVNKRINHVKYDEGFEDRFDIMINNTVDSSFEGKLTKKIFSCNVKREFCVGGIIDNGN